MKPSNKFLLVLALPITVFLCIAGLVTSAPVTVNLGTADNFAILAGTEITNVPNSAISGDVGLSPAAGSYYSGLTAAEVTGTIYDVNGTGPVGSVNDSGLLTTAKNDLTAAFTDAAGRTPVTTVPTELGGTTKTAGIYDSQSTTFGITAGAGSLILDGQSDPNAVFIFKMNAEGTGLTVGPGSTVSLINSAQACNVFWVVDTASIDTTAIFKGNVLALNSISVANGANIEGRLLARNGAVTLDQDTITAAECTAPINTVSTGTVTTATTLPTVGTATKGANDFWATLILGLVIAGSFTLLLSQTKNTNNLLKTRKEVIHGRKN